MTLRVRDEALSTDRREVRQVWLTVTEAAEVMRLSRNTLYRLVAVGTLPHRRLGRSIHIHRDIAERWTPGSIEWEAANSATGYVGSRQQG